LVHGSDNVRGAENQQERLATIGWVVGFVDGEGCFSSPIYRCRTMRLGWQVRPEFAVAQGATSRDVLDDLVRFFGCGKVFRNSRHDDHREDMYRFCVQRFADLRDVIVPFFREHPLRTSKRDNFEKFAAIIGLMDLRLHLSITGIVRIARIAETMNHRKPSEVLRILRDHTPTLFSVPGEEDEMVRYSRRREGRGHTPALVRDALHRNVNSEIPCQVSSDLHEWRNDLGTVSTGDSAKLQYE
jgi:hypothetical protein